MEKGVLQDPVHDPGVNFTKILQTAYRCTNPKSTKKLLNLTVFFALLGSARVKAACRMLVKLTPRGQYAQNGW